MATIQELLDLAYQIRDAEQNGENTALRVGQFLVELVNHFNTKADVDNISGAYHLKQQQAPIVALMSVQQMSDSNGQDNKAWWSTDGHIKYQHNGRIYDLGTPAYMLYYCGDKIYKWTGSATGFKLMTDGGGGSSGGGASVFANFAVAASTNELPDNGVATTGYIVGQNLYAYVGIGGDTKGGKYQNLGELNAAGVSLTTNGDGTFTVHAGSTDYTININHLHPQYLQAQVLKQAAYDALTKKDSKTLYFISDGNKLYLGSSLVLDASTSGGGGGGDDPDPTPDPEPTDSLPSGYTALEWLNGNGAVEINTNQAIPFDIETKFAPTDVSGYSVICGRVSSLMVAWNAQGQAWIGNAQSSLSPAPFSLNTDAVVTAKFRADANESEIKINGTDSGLHRATSADSSAFSILSNGSSYKAKGKLYYLKIYNATSGTLEKHLVPALDNNNTPCLYDIIGQTKYTFSGTVSSITTNLS